ncbi:putative transcription factor interactor and regulator CCHC(Zn) family [Helianthus annuus]|uniref:Transcription factor interactor and regulator CCHC(Zn) family n=1 Tax=Helianthus annuus TaxID=4232 RepID=A0A9K3GW41_HELAN|nr:putative transcription factor interactor and regulator CCHC(Zn) family [Helianthus annuus]KAJ0814896.1 putative transcription factor interactor and regulator CCHC(Zn) family [Helianthus annuus]KAJ0828127.1 putative transcription factor interactor and regulator CCHC(Zn) family [Helianthus annuus]
MDSKKAEIQPTATTMPCQHCLDEKHEKEKKFPRVRLCYYCHQPGHLIYSCKAKEHDETTQLINQAINAGIQRQEDEVVCRDEMIVTGTEGGESNFLFTRGIGAVEIRFGNETLRIQSVFHAPEIDRNVLSLDQLTLQGYTVKKSGDTCKIFPMFSASVMNSVNNVNGLTKEEELSLKEKQRVIDSSAVNDEYKEIYLNSYFEDLNLSTQEPDWSQMIIRNMEFHDFSDCKSLLEMMEDGEFVFKYKHELEGKFEEMLTWFINVRLGITTRPIPQYASDNRKVDLLGLYMVVKRDGGYQNVTDNNLWAIVAKDMGYEYHDGEFMRIIYAMYLDVLVYYHKFKAV